MKKLMIFSLGILIALCASAKTPAGGDAPKDAPKHHCEKCAKGQKDAEECAKEGHKCGQCGKGEKPAAEAEHPCGKDVAGHECDKDGKHCDKAGKHCDKCTKKGKKCCGMKDCKKQNCKHKCKGVCDKRKAPKRKHKIALKRTKKARK